MLFGYDAPKIEVNIDASPTDVVLNYANILKDEPKYEVQNYRAVKTRRRKFLVQGKHWIFKIEIFLYKYADPAAKYLELKGYEGDRVYLWSHSNGHAFKKLNSGGAKARFILLSVNEDLTDRVNNYDKLILTFESIDFVDRALFTILEGLRASPELRLVEREFCGGELRSTVELTLT